MTPEEMADRVATAIEEVLTERQARRPLATYRLQFHSGFTLGDAATLVPYLHALGVTHVYASPILRARSGSPHGYDVCSHSELNPELGGERSFEVLTAALQRFGMGQILDFVPNHMSASSENPWWLDLLENGPTSPYAHYFDVDWQPEKAELTNKILLPILEDQYGAVLESGQLQLRHADGGFALTYFDHVLPLGPKTTIPILVHRLQELEAALGEDREAMDEYRSIITALEALPPQTESAPDRLAERLREKEVIKRRLKRLERECRTVAEFVADNVVLFNGRVGEPASFDALDAILSQQAFRLCHWKAASDEINYRRFFDINELAAVCMEHQDVFQATHGRVLELLAAGCLDGVRLDHIDGLFDPLQYLWNLQRGYLFALGRPAYERIADPESPTWDEVRQPLLATLACRLSLPPLASGEAGRGGARQPDVAAGADELAADRRIACAGRPALPLYVLVEKILGTDEPLPDDWPVAGTTGYDFLSLLNSLFTEPQGLAEIRKFYGRLIGDEENYAEVVHRSKLLILRVAMSSELQMLAHRLNRISEQHRRTRDFTLNSLRYVLREILACFPVYRTYPRPMGVSERDRRFIQLAIARARRRNPALDASLFEFVRRILLLDHPEEIREDQRHERELFAGRFQQVTSPLMAKAVEDTAFYLHSPLASLNEVGGDPVSPCRTVGEFHRDNLDRCRRFPIAMLATSTHDTKRSEDVRARMAILSERPRAWRQAVNRWTRLNRRRIREVDGLPAPSRGDEYLFYQTLVGTWPLDPLDERGHEQLLERLQQYMQKATREAKRRTSWISPNAAYDEAVRDFVARAIERRRDNRFLAEVKTFVAAIAELGLCQSLAQVTLKILAPGVPDIYQGQELWDFSLVDPDNRRPVDYRQRRDLLADLQKTVAQGPEHQATLARTLGRRLADPRAKLLVTWRALTFRRAHPELFRGGDYLPLEATGAHAEHVCAFARHNGPMDAESQSAVVVVPRWPARLAERTSTSSVPLGAVGWGETSVTLPPNTAADRLYGLFSGQQIVVRDSSLRLGEVLQDFPVAVLTTREFA